MLEEIAQNDRGDHHVEHLKAIEAQLSEQPPLGLLAWNPLEVLELERWRRPDCEPQHIKRLLACTLLLRNACYVVDPSETLFVQTSANTILRLAESAIALAQVQLHRGRDSGQDSSHLALRFLLWVYPRQPHPEFRPFVCFCVLLLAAHIGLGEPSGEELVALCKWVEREEAKSRESLGHTVSSGRWLIGLNGRVDLAERRKDWVDAASRIMMEKRKGRTAEVQASLSSLAARLVQQ